ncbi:DUF4058 family protein [Candidatus Viridilinea mediisalina]|uniref:DUF4058 domain-containing protein n=1 Tax=Candidatus Viridilinea mediisalina TaxID=2024553 RepID=A0A2A6RLD4_9CHLR|nr:DUF4058 family protein [Candidatus Viridilinea mediisalina]PDW03725.1 hypothetical protein CJ255_07405 [Candidatus Viridilinea mediisalina]
MDFPFAGMNPYLEAPKLWPDVHHRLITAISDQLEAQIGPNYTTAITPYVSLERAELPATRMAVVPDVAIFESAQAYVTPQASMQHPSPSITPAPLRGVAPLLVPMRYARLEIVTLDEGALVTAIELLSPANKRPGPDGADAYEKKRQAMFHSPAHLLEIDLLRAGRRPLVQADLPPTPGFIYLSRAASRPQIEIWPVTWQEPLGIVPVPLRHPDPDIPLDLNACLRQIYASARYGRRIDYTGPPPPPDLTPAEAAWLAEHLHARGLR